MQSVLRFRQRPQRHQLAGFLALPGLKQSRRVKRVRTNPSRRACVLYRIASTSPNRAAPFEDRSTRRCLLRAGRFRRSVRQKLHRLVARPFRTSTCATPDYHRIVQLHTLIEELFTSVSAAGKSPPSQRACAALQRFAAQECRVLRVRSQERLLRVLEFSVHEQRLAQESRAFTLWPGMRLYSSNAVFRFLQLAGEGFRINPASLETGVTGSGRAAARYAAAA